MGKSGMKTGVVYEMDTLSSYVPDAIVSRTLVKSKGGNITLFAFGAGQGLSSHSAPSDAFVQVLDGEAIVTIGNDDADVKKGDMVLLPANIPHAIKTKSDFKMLLVMFKD